VTARGRFAFTGARWSASDAACRRLLCVLSLVLPFACGSCSETNQQTYKEAALATGITVASVGIYRAITRDCWARCRPGYLCNEESGLCELGECLPGCEYGTHCARDVRGEYRCVTDVGNQPIRSSTSAPAAPVTGASDAGVPGDAGPEAAATSAEPASPDPEPRLQ